jgi:hypothetical protein
MVGHSIKIDFSVCVVMNQLAKSFRSDDDSLVRTVWKKEDQNVCEKSYVCLAVR